MKTTCYSHGKLLISGEYAVLDGGLGLAVPTKYGQALEISKSKNPVFSWTSYDHQGNIWFEAKIPMVQLLSHHTDTDFPDTILGRLLKILTEARKLNCDFLERSQGYTVISRLEFPREWGLGSSSTLINNIAQWAGVDAFMLHDQSFGGSGYDIACAQHDKPILFRRQGGSPSVKEIDFNPPYSGQLFFVHLNRKQDSRESVRAFRQSETLAGNYISASIAMAERFMQAITLREFEEAMEAHELLVSEVLGTPGVGETLFPDYDGRTKSLGAWGGDFILATGGAASHAYFREKGYATVIPWNDMVL